MMGRDPHTAYHRPYLSKQFLRDELPVERVQLRQPDAYEKLDIEGRTQRRRREPA